MPIIEYFWSSDSEISPDPTQFAWCGIATCCIFCAGGPVLIATGAMFAGIIYGIVHGISSLLSYITSTVSSTALTTLSAKTSALAGIGSTSGIALTMPAVLATGLGALSCLAIGLTIAYSINRLTDDNRSEQSKTTFQTISGNFGFFDGPATTNIDQTKDLGLDQSITSQRI